MHCNLKAARLRVSRFGLFWPNMYYACAETAISKLRVKFLTPSLLSAIPIFYLLRIFWRSMDIHSVILTIEYMSHVALRLGIIVTKFVWTRSTDSFVTYNVFTADTLHDAVTLTSDAMTLNICSVSGVTWSNNVSNLSEIVQFEAKL